MKPDGAPLVSIITPAYNRVEYIGGVIESVLGQDYPNIEYIVIDDGSTDGTLGLIRRYGGRLRWVAQPNAGETETVNRGLAMARGDIIGVVNSDDPLRAGAVAAIVDFLVSRPDVIVAYPDWDLIDGEGMPIMHVRTPDYEYPAMLAHHHCIPGPGAFFRRSVVERLRGRDPRFRFVGDFDFWLRAGLLGPFGRVPLRLATFRHHGGSVSVNQKGLPMAGEHVAVVDKLYSLPGLPESARRVRRRAYGSAYLIAGAACGGGLSLWRLRYLVAAFGSSPLYCAYRSFRILAFALHLRARLLYRRLAQTVSRYARQSS